MYLASFFSYNLHMRAALTTVNAQFSTIEIVIAVAKIPLTPLPITSDSVRFQQCEEE